MLGVPPPPSTQPQPQPPQTGVGVAKTVAAPFLSAEVAPVLAGARAAVLTGAALTQAVNALLKAFVDLAEKRYHDDGLFVMEELQRQYPEGKPSQWARLVAQEQRFEVEFRRKQRERLDRDLPEALAMSDPDARMKRLDAIFAREQQFAVMRSEAMFLRALGKAEAITLKPESPEGAYWKLSPFVKEHTLDCLAMGEKFWPWEVLEDFQPPVHHGCACSLLGLEEAIRDGLMSRDQIPDVHDALARARDARKLCDQLHGRLSEATIREYIDSLDVEESNVYDLRFPAGTAKGGEYRPRRGGDPGTRVLHTLFPHPKSPLALRGEKRSRWTWVNGVYTRVPEADHWEKTVAGHKYTSPAGSTNVYRNGRLFDGLGLVSPERHQRRSAVRATPEVVRAEAEKLRAGMREQASGSFGSVAKAPVRVGDGPSSLLALRDAGWRVMAATPGTTGASVRMQHPELDQELDLDFDGHVRRVGWTPAPTPPPEGRALQHPPESWGDFRDDAYAWAHELGREHDARVQLSSVGFDRSMPDHAGVRSWSGEATLGEDVRNDVTTAASMRASGAPLADSDKAGVWASQWATAHEVAHSVNPMDNWLYQGHHANLEEALAEEAAHVEAVKRLLKQGQRDVLNWRERNPRELSVRGVYRRERAALGGLLDQAGIVDPAARREFIEDLKFRTDPADRFQKLAAALARNGAKDDDLVKYAEDAMAAPGDREGPALVFPSPGTNADEAWKKFLKRWDDEHGAPKGKADGKPKKSWDPLVGRKIGGDLDAPPASGAIPNYDSAELTYGETAGGTNGARWAFGDDGHRWLVKRYQGDQDRVATELLGNAVYRTLGARAPRAGTMTMPLEKPDFRTVPDVDVGEPKLPKPNKKRRVSAGVVVAEPDGRVWVIEPKGHFGDYEHTFPKGGVQWGYTGQQAALKELWEETGLHAHVTGYLGDYQGDTSVTRMYLAARTGGEPLPDDLTPHVKGSGKESMAVKLVSPGEAADMLNRSRDKSILADAVKAGLPTGEYPDTFPEQVRPTALVYPTLDGEIRRHFPASEKLGEHYMADALVGNWDFVGLSGDNVLWDENGEPIRLDQGGTFEMRAQGGDKPYGPVPTEVWTMLSKGQGQRGVVVSEQQMREQADRIAKTLSPVKIDKLVDKAPFADDAMRERVRENLKARVGWMRAFAAGEVELPKPFEGFEAHDRLFDAQADLKMFPEQEDALYKFANGGGVKINAALRKGEKKSVERDVKEIDSLLRHAQTADDVTAYVPVAVDLEAAKALAGKTLQEKGYMNLWVDRPDAGAVMRLTVPEGSHAVYSGMFTDMPAEAPDLIAARNSRVKIASVEERDGRVVLHGVLKTERPWKPWKPSVHPLKQAVRDAKGGSGKGPKTATFMSLRVGDYFKSGGYVYKKTDAFEAEPMGDGSQKQFYGTDEVEI